MKSSKTSFKTFVESIWVFLRREISMLAFSLPHPNRRRGGSCGDASMFLEKLGQWQRWWRRLATGLLTLSQVIQTLPSRFGFNIQLAADLPFSFVLCHRPFLTEGRWLVWWCTFFFFFSCCVATDVAHSSKRAMIGMHQQRSTY